LAWMHAVLKASTLGDRHVRLIAGRFSTTLISDVLRPLHAQLRCRQRPMAIEMASFLVY